MIFDYNPFDFDPLGFRQAERDIDAERDYERRWDAYDEAQMDRDPEEAEDDES